MRVRRALAVFARLRHEESVPAAHREPRGVGGRGGGRDPGPEPAPHLRGRDRHRRARLQAPVLPGRHTASFLRLRQKSALDVRRRVPPPRLDPLLVPGALIWTACHLSEKYAVPLVQSYHTHIPHYIPQYTWAGAGEADVGLHTPLDAARRPDHGHELHFEERAAGRTMPAAGGVAEGRGHGDVQPVVPQRGDARASVRRPAGQGDRVRRAPRRREEPQGAENASELPEGTNRALIGDGPSARRWRSTSKTPTRRSWG